MKIAAQVSLDDRYLHVQRTRNRYRIHLGAGGACRDGRHLFIVPKSELATGRRWLPIEGDSTLSFILTIAQLIAADDKITDPVILSQIRSSEMAEVGPVAAWPLADFGPRIPAIRALRRFLQ